MRWSSPVHDERVAARLGLALGVAFTICFLTGIYSHLAQHPSLGFQLPARPAGLYRFTQGLHVATGLAAIPLLFAKLWSVYPKLFQWPPFRDAWQAIERLMIVPLVAGGIFLLFTGLANINLWYPWRFNFPDTHGRTAWIVIGALVVHIGAKFEPTRRALRKEATPSSPNVRADRRAFLATAFGASAFVTLVTIGQTARPFSRLVLLAPRRAGTGPQGFPINATAIEAGVVELARAPEYRLEVIGAVATPLSLSLDELRTMEQRAATLPISCVEGWSTSVAWTGVPVRDLLIRAGAAPDATVQVESLQAQGSFRISELNDHQAHDRDTLLALTANGEELALDHGYPCRLIAPNRPGVMQTKWVQRLVVQ
jgi:hypothetical protein